jgi:hypothetical protein
MTTPYSSDLSPPDFSLIPPNQLHTEREEILTQNMLKEK